MIASALVCYVDKRSLLSACSLLQALFLWLAALSLDRREALNQSILVGSNVSGHLCYALLTLFAMLYTIGPGTVPFVLMGEMCRPHVGENRKIINAFISPPNLTGSTNSKAFLGSILT